MTKFNKKTKKLLLVLGVVGFSVLAFAQARKVNLNPSFEVGQVVDQLNGVAVYYNGGVDHVEGRNLAADGYNLGLKYQCVEFVKRYYYEHLKHKMPDSYGHAKDFFDPALADGAFNSRRDLLQYSNPSASRPEQSDLVVYDATAYNPYGHVAIVSQVMEGEIEIIQQNPGPFEPSRYKMALVKEDERWRIGNSRVLGWLHKDTSPKSSGK